MKKISKKIIVFFICLLPFVNTAQVVKETKTLGDKGAVSARIQRKAAKQKWKEQRSIESEQKKEIRDHDKRLQTRKTRKRMKENRKKSEKMRTNKRESWIVKLFKYKH